MPYVMFITEVIKVGVLKLSPVITPDSYNLLMVDFLSIDLKINASNASKMSDFSLRKCIHEYLENSSPHTKAYLFPPRLSTYIGPKRSMLNSSRILVVVMC